MKSRRISTKVRWGTLAVGAMLLALSGPAAAAVQVVATSTPQSPTPGGMHSASSNGNSTVYEYTIFDGGSVTDAIEVQFCVTSQENTNWTSFQVQTGQNGGGGQLPGVTRPGNLTFTPAETPVCKPATIQINTGPLTLGDPQVDQHFEKNLNISIVNESAEKAQNKPHVNVTGSTEIHVRVWVKPAVNNISCFITDSAGSLLTKCDGSPADQSGSDAGRFAIVANKKGIAVATNPGQFYYNVLYHNPGPEPIMVDVEFKRDGVSPKGAQAIHAALFGEEFSGMTQEDFKAVNDAIPEGSDDQVLGITIPKGSTLWVDYHLEWAGLGSTVPTPCATVCPDADEPFSVTSIVKVKGTNHSETCTAGAWGYKK